MTTSTSTTTRRASGAAAEQHTRAAWSITPYLADGWLPLFTVIMVCAAVIVANGTHRFYSYILPDGLDWFATGVLTLGIPCLEFAAALTPGWRWRTFYLSGLFILVGMESLAQYFQGQADFAIEVRAQFPAAAGIDIATLAAEPGGRWLIVGYIAILSLIVIFFGFAASMRFKAIRSAHAVVTERHEALTALHGQFTEASRRITELQQALTEKDEEVTEARTIAREATAGESATVTALRQQLTDKDREVTAAKASAHGLITPTYTALMDHIRSLTAAKTPVTEVARLVDVNENTLRSWLKK